MYPFKNNSFAPLNAWYVAAFADEVSAEMISKTILEKPIVIFRKKSGEAVALGGRCPHRHYPLGQSTLKDDVITCGYHGISFNSNGECVNIPSQNMTPKKCRIPKYTLVEHGIWLWIWMGNPAEANTALLPPLSEILPENMFTNNVCCEEVKCGYQLLNENLLDLTHIGYLHSNTIGVNLMAEVPEELTKTEWTLRSRRNIKSYLPSQMQQELFNHYRNIDSIVEFVYYAPGFHSGVGDHFIASDDPERPGDPLRIARTLHAITPSTRTSTYYFFAVAGTDKEAMRQAKATLSSVLDEDIVASESIEKMIELEGGHPEDILLISDKNAIDGRRMLQALIDKEVEKN